MATVSLAGRLVGEDNPTYFVADISANHDGDLDRAKMLIHLAAEAGADAAKFQNFQAEKIVSAHGFANLKGQLSHQAKWKRSVFEVYQDASLPKQWTTALHKECQEAGIAYFSAAYDFESVDLIDPFVSMFKIGSGDITWSEMLKKVAAKQKPVLLATGASSLADVQRAVEIITATNSELVLMQCNTNYTGSLENFHHIHLNVLRTYQLIFPSAVLGLSDHTPGHSTVLGAVALGARVIEKHFTDDNTREGPDHSFSMTPAAWQDMVERTRELEYSLGSANKFVAQNEQDTVVVQRRSLRAARNLKAGETLTRDLIEVLRPAPSRSIPPYELDQILGMEILNDIPAGECLYWYNLGAKK